MYKDKFKFRFFLEEEGKMIYSDQWSSETWDQIKTWHDAGKVMQVTGLKDVYKNDIYEGDIVEVFNTYKEEYFKGSVHYKNGSFYIRKDDLTSHYRWINYEIKVIGNVFENPKMLLT